jgi:hypothetical protein
LPRLNERCHHALIAAFFGIPMALHPRPKISAFFAFV